MAPTATASDVVTVARVTVFLPSLAGGGAERSILMVANGLAARGIELTLVLGDASGVYRGLVSPAVRVLDLQTVSLHLAIPPLVQHLRDFRPHALLSAMTHANVVAAMAHRWSRSSARLVLSERAHLTSVFEAHRGWRTQLTRQVMRWVYPWADAIVTVSQGVANDLHNHVPLPPGRVMALPNPVVDQSLLQAMAESPAHPWLFEPGPPVILGAGRLTAQKDFSTLISAFARLYSQRPARLLILGEGELHGELLAQVRRLNLDRVVDLPGFAHNPFSAMRAADVFVLSSRFEGLPGVLIQAMACGTPVVSTDCPSGPREILEGGRWGRLVPTGDVEALAAALLDTLDASSPPDVQRRAADFSEDAAVQAYAGVLGVA